MHFRSRPGLGRDGPDPCNWSSRALIGVIAWPRLRWPHACRPTRPGLRCPWLRSASPPRRCRVVHGPVEGHDRHATWDFGDGAPRPTRTRRISTANHGDYTVSLTVTGPGGTDSETRPSTSSHRRRWRRSRPNRRLALCHSPSRSRTPRPGSSTASPGISTVTGSSTTRRARLRRGSFDEAGDHTVGLSVTGPGGTGRRPDDLGLLAAATPCRAAAHRLPEYIHRSSR